MQLDVLGQLPHTSCVFAMIDPCCSVYFTLYLPLIFYSSAIKRGLLLLAATYMLTDQADKPDRM